MNAVTLAVVGLASLFVGYRFYSKFIAEKIYRLDPTFETPSHTMRDDIDYIPTHRVVLWGHHFTAVAGAAPIIGPGIAVIWGWLPAFIWVVLGTMFFAGVHDFGAVWASVRNRARSIGALTGDVVSQRARALFMIVIFLLLLMVNAVFAVAISTALLDAPSAVIPAWSAIAVALVIGVLIYRLHVPILWPTIVGTVILYAVIYLGERVPVELPQVALGLQPGAQWIVILFAYAAVASLLPVWLLLQPRDYINGIQLVIGLGLLYGTVLVAGPTIVAPAINQNVPPGAPPIVPLLFVTIACGAISGFHGLVGSGTTSKQLNKETDARFVGYLGSTGEGALALVAIIAATAGFSSLAEWETMYAAFGDGAMNAFVQGGATIVAAGSGFSVEFGVTLLTVMAVLFAGTTMDAGVRLQRYIIQEWGAIYNIKVLQNGYVAHLRGRHGLPDSGLRRRRDRGHRGDDHLAAVWHDQSATGRPDAAGHQRDAGQARTPRALYPHPHGVRHDHVVPVGAVSATGSVFVGPVSAVASRHLDYHRGHLRHARSELGVHAGTTGQHGGRAEPGGVGVGQGVPSSLAPSFFIVLP